MADVRLVARGCEELLETKPQILRLLIVGHGFQFCEIVAERGDITLVHSEQRIPSGFYVVVHPGIVISCNRLAPGSQGVGLCKDAA